MGDLHESAVDCRSCAYHSPYLDCRMGRGKHRGKAGALGKWVAPRSLGWLFAQHYLGSRCFPTCLQETNMSLLWAGPREYYPGHHAMFLFEPFAHRTGRLRAWDTMKASRYPFPRSKSFLS